MKECSRLSRVCLSNFGVATKSAISAQGNKLILLYTSMRRVRKPTKLGKNKNYSYKSTLQEATTTSTTTACTTTQNQCLKRQPLPFLYLPDVKFSTETKHQITWTTRLLHQITWTTRFLHQITWTTRFLHQISWTSSF